MDRRATFKGLNKGWQAFFVNGQRVNIGGFSGHTALSGVFFFVLFYNPSKM